MGATPTCRSNTCIVSKTCRNFARQPHVGITDYSQGVEVPLQCFWFSDARERSNHPKVEG